MAASNSKQDHHDTSVEIEENGDERGNYLGVTVTPPRDVGDIESEHNEEWNWTNEEEVSIDKCMDPEIYKFANSPYQLKSSDVVSPLGNTSIHLAASVGHLEHIKQIVCQFPELFLKKNNDGNLPLHVAASAGHLSTVCFLVEISQTNLLIEKNKRGNTALHVALENHHLEVAKFLMEKDGSMLWYSANVYHKSPFSIAAEAGNYELVDLMMQRSADRATESQLDGSGYFLFKERWEGSSIMRAAILRRDIYVLTIILKHIPSSLIDSTDEEGMTAHTLAAYMGDIYALQDLLFKCPQGAYKRDANGSFPIHLASRKGHTKSVGVLLNWCPGSRNLLDDNEWNILHVAVWHRRDNMVKYILKMRELEVLLNQRDKFGSTPLHLAVRRGYPKTVSILASHRRVNLSIRNHESHTAMEIARMSLMGEKILFLRRPLTVMALTLANASRSQERRIAKVKPAKVNYSTATEQEGDFHTGTPKDADSHRQTVNNLLLVSTLVATVTFAAGFTVPGGYKSSGSDEGMATLVTNWPFKTFLICNTIAMYSSITVAISLLWAQTGDMSYASVRFGLPILGVALSMMLVAFMAGVALVTSNLIWLSIFVVITGSIFLVIILVLLIPLIVPISSKNRVTRFILHCIFRLLLNIPKYDDVEVD